MKVLLVSGDFKRGGGMDRANYELAWHLADEVDVNVHLVAYHVAEPLASHPNVTWRQVPKPLNSYSLGASLLANRATEEARCVQQQGGRTIVNGGNCPWPDINWVHAVHQGWERRLMHAPARVRVRQWISRGNALRTEKQALAIAKVVVANSEQTRDKLIELFGISADRIHTIYLGVDPQVFRPATHYEKLAARTRLEWPTRKLTAIFVGSLGYDRNKGFDLLFAAWQQLCADPDWDVDLVAVGDGAEVPYWQSQSEKAGLSGCIRVMGFTPDVAELLRAADVMIQPSFYEAYGLAAHEALCCGIPAMVTRSSGVAERYPFSLSELLLNAPPTLENLVQKLHEWRADWQGHRARVQVFSSKLRQRTWADMAHDFVELTMPSLIAPVKAVHRGTHAARYL